MPFELTPEEFATPSGRKKAWKDLFWNDHGFLRKLYDNSHCVVAGKMWRSYQPDPDKLEQWRDRGIRTVINLRGPKPSGALFLEEAACADLGIAFRTLRAYSREAPRPEFLHGIRALFDEIEYPAVMHCKSGADRAGLGACLFLFFHEETPLDEAMAQLSWKYGHVRSGKTGVIDFALEKYIAHARARNIPLTNVDEFFNWVDTVYDPVATKAEFKAGFWGNLLSDTILRRE